MPQEWHHTEQAARMAVNEAGLLQQRLRCAGVRQQATPRMTATMTASPTPATTSYARVRQAPRRAWAAGPARRVVIGVGLRLTAAAALLGLASCSQPQPRAEAPAAAYPQEAPPTAAPSAQPAPGGLLAIGASAPDVAGKDAAGQPVSLHTRQGHVSIVYFYPKDGTPGCTKEACAFRDTFDRFTQRGVTIFGVSRDDEASHAKFRAEHSLPFPLVADPSGAVQRAYGVPDRMPGIASRVTFLVAADGRIARVWPEVDPAVHADEVFAAIEQLK